MSVTLPPLNQFATDAYAYLEPIADQDEALGYPLAALIGGLGMAFDQVEQVARAQPGRQPYQQVYDITRTPDFMLGWLGQFVGVPWTAYTDAVAKRQQVMAEVNFYRGSIPNLIAAALAQQTAPNRTTVTERVGDAWGIDVAYDPAYTPDVTAYEQAVIAAIPWALALTIVSASVPLFDEGTLIPDTLSSSIHFDTATLAQIT